MKAIVVVTVLALLSACSTPTSVSMAGSCKTSIESDCQMRSFDQPRYQ